MTTEDAKALLSSLTGVVQAGRPAILSSSLSSQSSGISLCSVYYEETCTRASSDGPVSPCARSIPGSWHAAAHPLSSRSHLSYPSTSPYQKPNLICVTSAPISHTLLLPNVHPGQPHHATRAATASRDITSAATSSLSYGLDAFWALQLRWLPNAGAEPNIRLELTQWMESAWGWARLPRMKVGRQLQCSKARLGSEVRRYRRYCRKLGSCSALSRRQDVSEPSFP